MAEKIQAPRGTFDVLPDEARGRHALEESARAILEPAGYGRVETPVFEGTELFARGVGESTDIVQKEMYTFEDGGGRSLTLRPEGTAPICRAYVEHGMHKLPQPVKLWYLSTFFRYERAQAGRYRQFWQIGAEAIGSDDPAVDAELIALLASLLQSVEVRASGCGSRASAPRRAARRTARSCRRTCAPTRTSSPRRSATGSTSTRSARSTPTTPGTRAVMERAPRLLDRLPPDDAEHFAEVRAMLDAAGVEYEIDPSLVRGLDYYTRTVFEFTSDALGAQSGVGGGGRYDGLVEQLGGPPTPGCGWASGVERIRLAAAAQPTAPAPVDLYVALAGPEARADAFAITAEARRAGLGAVQELAGRSVKGQLKQADRLRARYVAVVGPDGATSLRDLSAGTEEQLDASEVVVNILRERGMG